MTGVDISALSDLLNDTLPDLPQDEYEVMWD